MSVEVMTGEELAATPLENRYYRCMTCRETGTDGNDFQMVVVLGIGWVVHKECLHGKETQ